MKINTANDAFEFRLIQPLLDGTHVVARDAAGINWPILFVADHGLRRCGFANWVGLPADSDGRIRVNEGPKITCKDLKITFGPVTFTQHFDPPLNWRTYEP